MRIFASQRVGRMANSYCNCNSFWIARARSYYTVATATSATLLPALATAVDHGRRSHAPIMGHDSTLPEHLPRLGCDVVGVILVPER